MEKNKIWQELYRPKTMKDVISVHTDKILNAMQNPKSMQNLLLYSSIGGTGKSSVCKAIINDLKADVLVLNASNDRSIDMIRTKVIKFAQTMSTNPKVKKIIFMDEFERLTLDAAEALKNLIETYSSNVLFLCTTNNINKIGQPLQSRFNIMDFSKPPKDKILKYLENICIKENLKYEQKGLEKLISLKYPSIRNMVNVLQDLKISNKDVIEKNIKGNDEEYKILLEMIYNKKFNELSKKIIIDNVDCRNFNRFLYEHFIKTDLEIPKKYKIFDVLAKTELGFIQGADEQIVMTDTIMKLMVILK